MVLLVVYHASRPRIGVLGRVPGVPGAYGDVGRHPDYEPVPGLLVLRLEAPLFYANAAVVRDRIKRLVGERDPTPRGGDPRRRRQRRGPRHHERRGARPPRDDAARRGRRLRARRRARLRARHRGAHRAAGHGRAPTTRSTRSTRPSTRSPHARNRRDGDPCRDRRGERERGGGAGRARHPLVVRAPLPQKASSDSRRGTRTSRAESRAGSMPGSATGSATRCRARARRGRRPARRAGDGLAARRPRVQRHDRGGAAHGG